MSVAIGSPCDTYATARWDCSASRPQSVFRYQIWSLRLDLFSPGALNFKPGLPMDGGELPNPQIHHLLQPLVTYVSCSKASLAITVNPGNLQTLTPAGFSSS